MSKIITLLNEILADTYALYVKTQNFHWNVTGENFSALHLFFEGQYEELAEAVDVIAERIRALDHKVPAGFNAFQKITNIKEGNPDTKASAMLQELAEDHQYLCKKLKKAHEVADETSDIGTVALIEDRIREHEKAHWMLQASA